MSKTRVKLIFQVIVLSASILVLFNTTASANLDSLQHKWVDTTLADSTRFKNINFYFEEHVYADPEASLNLAKYQYELAKQRKSTQQTVKAIINKATALGVLGRYDEALQKLEQSIDICEEVKDTISLADSYYLMGRINHYQSKYLPAANHLLRSLNLYQDKELSRPQARNFNALGSVYYEINNLDLALETYNKGLRLAEKYSDEKSISSILINTGFLNYELKNYERAIELSTKSLKSFQQLNHLVGIADCYYLLAQSYHANNQIDSALFYVNKSLDVNLSIGNSGQIIPTKLLLGKIMFSIDVKESKRIVETITPSLNTSFGYAYLKQAYQLLYKCYKAENNLPLALNMHEKFVEYSDSLLIEEDNLSLTRQALQSKHDIELLNNELENEKIQSALKFSQLKRTFAIVLFSLILVLMTVFYARSSILKQRNEKHLLLDEIDELKSKGNSPVQLVAPKFELIRSKIEEAIGKRINETDWKVLNILLEDPVISNKDIAAKAFLTVDGIGSCLRRMYVAFDLKESKYKKIALIMKAIKLSNVVSESEIKSL